MPPAPGPLFVPSSVAVAVTLAPLMSMDRFHLKLDSRYQRPHLNEVSAVVVATFPELSVTVDEIQHYQRCCDIRLLEPVVKA